MFHHGNLRPDFLDAGLKGFMKDQGFGFGVVQNIFDFPGSVDRVDGNNDAAGLEDGIIADEGLNAVGVEDGDVITVGEAQLFQPIGNAIGYSIKSFIADSVRYFFSVEEGLILISVCSYFRNFTKSMNAAL
jgi:hypothetical protein